MLIDRDSLRPVQLSNTLSRTQDCVDLCMMPGQFYWGSVASWTTREEFWTQERLPLRLNRLAGLDVDAMEDWFLLNALIKYREADNVINQLITRQSKRFSGRVTSGTSTLTATRATSFSPRILIFLMTH